MHEKGKRDHCSHKYLANTANSIVPFLREVLIWLSVGFFARSDKNLKVLTISEDKKEADANARGSDHLSKLLRQFEDINIQSIQEEYFF